jgi:peptidoglycan/xylan/chitin deacetylase (PgdA/CDA1 family)
MTSKKTIVIIGVGALIVAMIGIGLLALALTGPLVGQDEAEMPAPPRADSLYPGTYRLGTGVNNPNGPAQYVLELRPDGTATNTTYPSDPAEPIHVLNGSWTVEEGRALLTLTERDGSALDEPLRIVFVYRDLFLVAVEHPFGDQQYEFTLGTGDEHPAVRQLHQLLASLPWLNYQDPGPTATVYDEETRRAVMTFQISQGLPPSGVVDQQTWTALNDPVQPVDTATPSPPAEEATRPPADLPGSVDERPTHIDGQPVVYLTFDDGPTGYTDRVQELLAQHNAYATFFLIGQQVNGAVGTGAAQGNYQANHTHSHVSLSGLDLQKFRDEVGAAYDAIQRATNGQDADRDKLLCLRPPFGETDGSSEAFASQLGYELVMWDIDPQDWRQPGADQIADHIINNAYPGAIVLLHDGGGNREQTLDALATVLSVLGEQGYRFESLCR